MNQSETDFDERLRNMEAAMLATQAVLTVLLKRLQPMGGEVVEQAAQQLMTSGEKHKNPLHTKALAYVDMLREGVGD